MKKVSLIVACLLTVALGTRAQQNDATSPLHLLQPDYKTPYGALTVDEVKSTIDRVLHYLEAATPIGVVDSQTGEAITDYKKINENSAIAPGTFRLTSYEWGVTYSAVLAAAAATGDKAYYDYAADRMKFLVEVAPYFKKAYDKSGGNIDEQMKKVVAPAALDDAGAVCVAMIKALQQDKTLPLQGQIDYYMDYVLNKEYRLSDGTFARTRPQYNTLWLDDMFMGIPPVAYYALCHDDGTEYLSQAVSQILNFAKRMWVPEKKLFRHGWVEGMADHPAFHWGRANGWALLTLCEVLDVLPTDFPQRDALLSLLREHAQGLAACQGADGFWHQLLDRNDSYEETSATAIYVYCFAHAINKGWLDALAYGPQTLLGWHAVATQITDEGQVDGVCVGTGMGFDPAYYCYRPVNVFAAHGYGPAIWAGAEVITLLQQQHPKMNDSALQFYHSPQDTAEPIFHVND